jgi:biopolymer transport protein ExbD
MKKRRFLKRGKQTEEMSLQITSMADIFIILLVFLLKSYTSGTITINPSQGTQLPNSTVNDKAMEAMKVEISEGSVLVEGKPIAKISAFTFDQSDLVENGISKSLQSAFEEQRNRSSLAQGAALPAGSAPQAADPRIIVIADQRAPYQTIKTVLASAATQGYTDVKLAVIHND